MSDPQRRLVAAPAPEAGGGQSRDERHHRRSNWPATRLPAAALTAVLALTVTAPTVLHDLRAPLWPALLVPALLATLAARLVFESVDGGVWTRKRGRHLPAALAGALVAATIMAAATLVLGLGNTLAITLLTLAPTAALLSAAGFLRDMEIRRRLALRRVYFAGTADTLEELRHELARSPEASLVGATGPHPPLSSAALTQTVLDTRATVLVLDRDAARAPVIAAAAAELRVSGVRIRDLLGYYESEFKKVPLTELTPAWFLFEPEHGWRRALADVGRRAFMVTTAAVMLVLTAPLIALLMLAVRLSSPGPAIFRQQRVGKDGSRFMLFKLRTMDVPEADPTTSATAVWATDEGHRITRLGRFLRRYRLDELPQLLNVMRGELALIGPRPEQVAIVERLEREIPFYEARHTIRPGLTGWAQVNLGYAGSLAGARAKLQRDLFYVKHRRLRLDLLILWLTVKAVSTDPH